MASKIISITPYLNYFGGAQQVMVDVHEGIRDTHEAKIMGFEKFKNLLPKYGINASEYVQFTNPFYLNNKILIVHGRNVMAIIMIMKRLFFLNTKILYVAHNVYDNHRTISFFPKKIISISQKVTENLLSYFNLKNRDIRIIYNGIKDEMRVQRRRSYRSDGKIIILYSGRVNGVKRQLEIVTQLKGKLHSSIEIHFAGSGADFEALRKMCACSSNFKTLGFIENVNDITAEADYLMLFSVQEGLPISLIEGLMHGKPLLMNDVGGNLEIGVPGLNGIELKEDWTALADTLNGLISVTEEAYEEMSRQSRQRYEERFTYQNMISNYLNVIETMM